MHETVILTDAEKSWVTEVARARQGDGSRRDRAGATGGLAIHVAGAGGELAAAKCLGITWPAYVNTFHGTPDLEPDIEVKTRRNHAWEMIVRPSDPVDGRRYVLVTKEAGNPEFRVHGWMPGEDIKTEAHWNTDIARNGRPPAWVIDQHELSPITVLRLAVAEGEQCDE